MELRNILFLFFLMCIPLFAQTFSNNQTTVTGNFGTEKSYDSKSVLSYYQDVYSTSENNFKTSLLPSYDIDKQKLAEELRNSLVLDGPVDPENYLIGPGDVLQINVWGELQMNFALPVTPEGNIVVPSHGVISVKDLTLAQAKDSVAKTMGGDFIKSNITTTILQPRMFTVYVAGAVNNPGSQYAMAVQRVDQVVYLANLTSAAELSSMSAEQSQKKEMLKTPDAIQYFNDNQQLNPDLEMSLRNIKLIRRNGDTLLVDLVSFYATGNVENNPYLNDGDRIIVPNLDLEGNSLTVSGAVRLKGTYEYSPNDKMSKVLDIAQGTTAYADLENVDYYTLTPDGFNYRKVNLQAIISKEADDISLKAGDRIVIREHYPRNKARSITIKGEVVKPGLYPIIKNQTKLSEVINTAGGFTDLASLNQAKIIRYRDNLDKALNNPDYQRILEMRLSDLDEEERAYFNLEAAVKRNLLSVDFTDLFINGNEDQDIILEDGDIILIPETDKTIYIYGQIAQSGYLEYVEGKGHEYYIKQAGGTSVMANESDLMVIKAGTQNWVNPDDTTLEPGDTIFIPRDKDTDFEYYFNWFSRVVSVVGSVATIILLVTK